METSVRINEITQVIVSVANTEGAVRKRNILSANVEMPGLMSKVAYLLGMIPPGFKENLIVKPLFYVAEPRLMESWDDLMIWFLRHPKGGEDNILIAQRYLRSKHRYERKQWEDILAKKYRLGNELYLIHYFFEEEKFNESTYLRYREQVQARNRSEITGS